MAAGRTFGTKVQVWRHEVEIENSSKFEVEGQQ